MLNELINRINIYTPMIGRNRIGKEKIIQSTISLWVCYSNLLLSLIHIYPLPHREAPTAAISVLSAVRVRS